jgi:hypothetical protein
MGLVRAEPKQGRRVPYVLTAAEPGAHPQDSVLSLSKDGQDRYPRHRPTAGSPTAPAHAENGDDDSPHSYSNNSGREVFQL